MSLRFSRSLPGSPARQRKWPSASFEEIGAPYELQGQQAVVGVSIGIAITGEGPDSQPDTLLKNADIALYQAKADGRGKYCLFHSSMRNKMQARRAIELDLTRSVAA